MVGVVFHLRQDDQHHIGVAPHVDVLTLKAMRRDDVDGRLAAQVRGVHHPPLEAVERALRRETLANVACGDQAFTPPHAAVRVQDAEAGEIVRAHVEAAIRHGVDAGGIEPHADGAAVHADGFKDGLPKPVVGVHAGGALEEGLEELRGGV